MFRRSDLHENRYGMMDAWRHKGYSDDMIVGGVCVEHVALTVAVVDASESKNCNAHDSILPSSPWRSKR